MDKVNFTINGESYTLSGADIRPDTTLHAFLRARALLGTKAMCREGGCGACVVSVERPHPTSGTAEVLAVNSCLVHILSCHKWSITTVEGVGGRRAGYQPLQRRLAAFNGTQCGYCTPGWIMNMHSLSESGMPLSMKEIENSFGGNMCRCTGYRPILDAFKSFATDVSDHLKGKIKDLEDLDTLQCLAKPGRRCSTLDDQWCVLHPCDVTQLSLQLLGSRWYKVYRVPDLFTVLDREGAQDYVLVNGNTGKGVYPAEDPPLLIDISSIAAMKEVRIDCNLILGAGLTLTEAMSQFHAWAARSQDFAYLGELRKHLDLVAHVPVRNIGTIGGNLAVKHQHNDFPSDVFLVLDTVGAFVTLVGNDLIEVQVSLQDFLKADLSEKLILNVILPPLGPDYHIRTYKIMPRAQNAHAIMNAGFLFRLDAKREVKSCRLAYGHVAADFRRARTAEDGLLGKVLFNDETLQQTLEALDKEIVPKESPPDPSPFCRKTLSIALFYKAILSLAPHEQMDKRYVSGGTLYERGVSRGTQTFDTDKTLWPLNQPIPKLEALAQCAGEARFTDDAAPSPRELHAALVLSTVCVADIESIDASDALKLPGVEAVLTAKDIPGSNTFTPLSVPWQSDTEEVLASSRVLYHGQPLAVVAATSREVALQAAKRVKVTYKNIKESPVLSIADALKAPDAKERMRQDVDIKATDRGTDVTKVIKGSLEVPSQYHYTMETQTCRAEMTENGLEMVVATQWMDLVHVAVAGMLGLKENEVNITVPRVGGGYGGKASRASLCACACALVSWRLSKAVRLVLPLTDNMAAIGKRQACSARFEVGVNDAGLIQYLDLVYYTECGCSYNESSCAETARTVRGLYRVARWSVRGVSVRSDTPAHTWCRAPATTEGNAIIEHIMERIAFATNKDPTDVKILNLAPEHDGLKDLVLSFKTTTKYEERKAEIQKFNSENAWQKRSIKIAIMSYPISYADYYFSVTISVYHADGTVALSHSGVEMGQGIHTKVAQVCAYSLKIPLEKVSVKPTNNLVSPNSMASSGSVTSEMVAYATVKACEDLLKRLDAVKEKEATWEETVKKAFDEGVHLQSSYLCSSKDQLQGYSVYGAAVCEVQLDCLTGRHEVLRVDLVEDTGRSISPDIDVGQIEGAFVMGLGLWTCEHLVYERGTGRLLTSRTWTYTPPGAKDIPLDFRIHFRPGPTPKQPVGVLRSKATGEPALVTAVVVTHALHDAIMEARKEHGYRDTDWVHVDTPYNVENILKGIAPKIESYKLK